MTIVETVQRILMAKIRHTSAEKKRAVTQETETKIVVLVTYVSDLYLNFVIRFWSTLNYEVNNIYFKSERSTADIVAQLGSFYTIRISPVNLFKVFFF